MIKQGVQYRVIHHLFQVSKLSIECNETKTTRLCNFILLQCLLQNLSKIQILILSMLIKRLAKFPTAK